MDFNDYSDQFEETVSKPDPGRAREEQKAEAKPPRFVLIPFGDISLNTEPSYLISGMVPRSGLIVMWGPPKCGKSFKAFDMFMAVARNIPYRDHKVKGGPVVYIALEGHAGFKKRIVGYRQNENIYGAEHVPFYLVGGTLDLVKDHVELIKCIHGQVGDTQPVAVVVDTLNRSLAGSESSDADMSAYIKAADAIRDAFSCAVAIVHHCGHDTTRPRGHTSLFGAADCMISVKRDGGNNIVTAVQYTKDDEPAEPMLDRLESVEVGKNDDGDPITTCIVRPVEGSPIEPDTRKRGSDRDVLAIQALTEALLDHGKPLPASFKLPNGTKGCTIDQWRAELYTRAVFEKGNKSDNTKFIRLRERLDSKNLIGVRGGYVWLVRPQGADVIRPRL